MKVLLATDKPFSKEAVTEIRAIIENGGHEFALLEKYKSKDELLNAVTDANAIIIRSDKVTREVLDSAPEMKIVVRAGAGYDNVDLQAATEKSVVVMNTPGQNSNAVAELAIGMMVYGARNLFNGKTGFELKGKTLGIHAYGNVGKLVATIAKGFGMQVSAFDPFIADSVIESDGVKVYKTIEDLYSNNQFISIHIPATTQTKKSINFELLSNMPKNAVLVNTARKEVIDEDGLVQLMREREDFMFLTDIAPDNGELLLEKFSGRCYFTPQKIGAQTSEANINAGFAAARQILKFFSDGDTTFQVNK